MSTTRRLLLLLLVLQAGCSCPAAAATAVPTVLLHLSDIHYSTNIHGKYWRAFGDREGDATLWATQLVPRLAAQGALITGDITDSKTARGEGKQQEEEWLAYARLLSNLSAVGIPPERVWDLPGNHDRFNVPLRGGPQDFFARHSAEGQRSTSVQQRVFVHRLPRQGTVDGAAAADCPAAWLVGIDPSPDPGLRSPTNFAGLARPALLVQVHAALVSIQEQQPTGCGPPLTLAHTHYPLSTIDSSPQHTAGPPGILLHVSHSVQAMQGLTKLLALHNVSAVFSGHLHSSFGQRMHRLHPTPSGGLMAELETAAWKDDRRFRLVALDGGLLTFLDLMFHTRNAPRMPRRSDATAMGDAGWQEAYAQRGWAVTSLDSSAAVVEHIAFITSPPDGRYSSLGSPAAAAAAAAAAAIAGNGSSGGSGEGQRGLVRALVYSLDAGAAASSGQVEVELSGFLPSGVQLFSRHMQLAAGGSASSGDSGDSSAAAPLLFEGQGETTVSCVGQAGDPAAHCLPPAEHVHIQVSVKGASGRVSRSPRQPVALRCAALTTSHQQCWVAGVEGNPLPLGVSPLEWLGLAFNWPVLVHRLFILAWAFQVCILLVAPRLLARRMLPLIAASPLLQCRSDAQLPSTPKAANSNGGVGTVLAQAGRAALSYLLWPVAALFVSASVTEVWAAQLAYSIYLLVGPWLLYTALTGYPLAMLFHFGVIGQLEVGDAGQPADTQRWRFVGTPDTMFVCLVHFITCMLPATLWVACVVARRVQLHPHGLSSRGGRGSRSSRSSSRSSSEEGGNGNGSGSLDSAMKQRMEAGGGSSSSSLLQGNVPARRASWADSTTSTANRAAGRWSFSWQQLAALAGLLAFNTAALYYKAWSLMGVAAVLASPGLAWTLPLAVLLVTVWGVPSARRACGQAGKGE